MKRVITLVLCLCLLLFTAGSIGVLSSADTAASLDFTVSYGTTDGAVLSSLTPYDDDMIADLSKGITDGVAVDSTTGIPVQVFTVNTDGVVASEITLTANVATIENERIAMKVYNPSTDSWDLLATAMTRDTALTAQADLATYAVDGAVKVMLTPDYVANGSNVLLWSTDQQHYTKFEDLNQTYYDINTYAANEYKAGNIAYMINTGDIVDDTPMMATAKGQWIVADKAFDILDEAAVPYGIVTGNHDVGDYPSNNYTHYDQYFNADRYENRPWYGGTPDNNRSHYDLVTAGNKDLLILYLGFGLEAMELDWCNEVIAKYPHRSVIICTHQYLSPTQLVHKGRADIIFNSLVVPNKNVVMVLSGHYEGAGYYTQELDDGRIVQEVVADYQFVQKESEQYYIDKGVKDPLHKIGAVANCNGEGYMRNVTIKGNTVTMFGFSPVTGGETPYGQRDDITLTVPFVNSGRFITTYAFHAQEGATDAAVLPDLSTEELAPLSASANLDNLQAMIKEASSFKKKDFTEESYNALKEAVKDAKSAVKSQDDMLVSAAAQNLEVAMGALCERDNGMDPDKLTLVHAFDMNLSNWQNADGTKSLFTDNSFIKATQLESGGFTAEKSDKSNIGWPAVKYKEILNFTPEDGKVYLYLDVEAGSTWSVYPTVIQDGKQYMGRWNYVIEGSYNETFDAGCGHYKGVYDITPALEDLGVDPTQEMTLTMTINVVPGPVTFHDIRVLTGDYPEGIGLNTNMLFVIGGVVILVILAVVLVIVLRKPKEKSN